MQKILIANRGEIAVRVMRTCREMGIQTVAVYSEPDRDAVHVRYADEAYCIGPAAAKESYLCIDKIIEVAQLCGADGVHPGYGFLSENPDFVTAVLAAGLIFIGPPASAMEAMGSKTRSRQVMQAAGVPVVPGLLKAVDDGEVALSHARAMGFPVMLKAAAGGGGKGMRKVDHEQGFAAAYQGARSEAKNAFGDDAVYIEKYLARPRHIEIQIFADTHGNIISFPERECSVQRRHQKVIEESPSAFVTPQMREKMGEVARQAARAVHYVGAGTIEFLADAHQNFYFMEMNTRLQVEHPVTEMVTGLDLVEWQIRVARGEKLPIMTQHVPHTGWAMEARICAEDPEANFMPSPGTITYLNWPAGPYVRIDAAVVPGTMVTMDYDPMIAKVIVWGKDRASARLRLLRAMQELQVSGCMTNRDCVRRLLTCPAFVSGEYDTSIIGTAFFSITQAEESDIATLVAAQWEVAQRCTSVGMPPTIASSWRQTASPFLVGI